MKKTAQDLLKGSTLIVGGPGTGKTFLTMEFIKELKKIHYTKILVVDHEHELKEFSKEVDGVTLGYKFDEDFPESNSWLTILIPTSNSFEMYDYLSNNAQVELEKILSHALDCDVDLLFLSPNAVSYFLLNHIEKYREYLDKIKVVVQMHWLIGHNETQIKNFTNVIAFACDPITANLLNILYNLDAESLCNQKRGEFRFA